MLSLVAQAWNSWKNAKGVALLAILALAIGIGSATAIYTVAHTVLLKPLPYREGGRFVAVYGAIANEPGKKNGMSDGYLRTLQQHQRSFDVFGWFTVFGSFNLTSPGEPQHIDGARVTPELVDNLGVNLVLGRWFRGMRQENGNSHLAVLAYPLWQRLGGRKDILGKPSRSTAPLTQSLASRRPGSTFRFSASAGRTIETRFGFRFLLITLNRLVTAGCF